LQTAVAIDVMTHFHTCVRAMPGCPKSLAKPHFVLSQCYPVILLCVCFARLQIKLTTIHRLHTGTLDRASLVSCPKGVS